MGKTQDYFDREQMKKEIDDLRSRINEQSELISSLLKDKKELQHKLSEVSRRGVFEDHGFQAVPPTWPSVEQWPPQQRIIYKKSTTGSTTNKYVSNDGPNSACVQW